MRNCLAAVLAEAAVAAVAFAAAGAAPAGFEISPNPARMDDRLSIKVTGLPPHQRVTIRARSMDQGACWWRSSADFRVAPDGSLDLSAAAPLSGTYSGADAMGLFWSMQPGGSGKGPAFFQASDWFRPVVTDIDAALNGQLLETARVVRYFAMPGVRAEAVKRDGVVGIIYRPADNRRHPGVLVLGGSEGGFPSPQPAMLASRGFVALALAYFGADGVPQAMQRIPVEYFGKAIQTLRSHPAVQGSPVTVLGSSRGAEAALMVGSTFPEVNGVAAVSASHVRWEGATSKGLPGGPAWTSGGRPLPYVPFHIGPLFAARYLWAAVTGSSLSLRPMFVDSLGRAEHENVQIAVERIRGPVLLGSGADDRKWPSAMMSQRAMNRLRRNRHPYQDEHVSYEAAGHWLPTDYLPTGGLKGGIAEEIGGTPEGTAAAQRQWWPRVLRFLAFVSSDPR